MVASLSLVHDRVAKAHEGVHGGHDIHHVVRVATWAKRIALDEWNDEHIAYLAEIAALCHNADRLLESKYGRGNAFVPAIEELILSWLEGISISSNDCAILFEAVLGHNKPNDDNHSRVQIALMDADKLTNMAMDLIIRSAQLYHDQPAVDMEWYVSDSNVTYRNPGSCLKDIWYTLEWVDPKTRFCFRTRLGWEVGKKRAFHIEGFINLLKGQLTEDGIVFRKREEV